MPGLRDTLAELLVATVALMLRSSASARSSSYEEGPTGLQMAVGVHGASISSARGACSGVVPSIGSSVAPLDSLSGLSRCEPLRNTRRGGTPEDVGPPVVVGFVGGASV